MDLWLRQFVYMFFLYDFYSRYKAVYNYKPQNSDELELREGDIVQVMEKCDDGWFVGKEIICDVLILKCVEVSPLVDSVEYCRTFLEF